MDRKNIEEAKVNCASKFQNSGKLFEPTSLIVNNLIWEEFKDTIVPKHNGPWIGIGDQETHSVYKYFSSGSVVSFTPPWLATISLSSSDECVILWKDGKWNEISCSNTQVSICEQ